MANDYFELLNHPMWQKKRLTILEMHGYECEECGETEKKLNVHHTYYEKGLKPWEYPNRSLRCLCDKCHKKAHEQRKELNRAIGYGGTVSLERISGYIFGSEAMNVPPTRFAVHSNEFACGVGDAFGVPEDRIIESLDENQMIDGFDLERLSIEHRISELKKLKQIARKK